MVSPLHGWYGSFMRRKKQIIDKSLLKRRGTDFCWVPVAFSGFGSVSLFFISALLAEYMLYFVADPGEGSARPVFLNNPGKPNQQKNKTPSILGVVRLHPGETNRKLFFNLPRTLQSSLSPRPKTATKTELLGSPLAKRRPLFVRVVGNSKLVCNKSKRPNSDPRTDPKKSRG